ncbi:uncharacterized protein LOC106477813, partial [Limulus polyphemus]|uniref:Uncharacterized protein LOC106477813 n=1 Tax=Limulus polyphemus TaxID=6850 RepID=A0ABM1C433_LIMPO
MGAVLAVPLGFFLYHLLTTDDLSPMHGVYNLPNRFFWLKKITSCFYLKIKRWMCKKRFDLYDMSELTDLVKTGSIPPEEEKVLEEPQTDEHLSKNTDDIFFYGVNSTGECLVVQMCRLQNKMVEVMVLVKTADGRCYSYPDRPTKTIVSGEGFAGGGLKLKCVNAMRKWRISFNGLLKESCKGSGKDRVVHVKFSFIWLAMSNVQDLSTDIDLTEALAKEPWSGYLPNVSSLEKALNIYEQGGQLLGTVTVEGQEEEFTLWGTRRRRLGPLVQLHRSVDFFGFTKNGGLFHIGAVSLPGIVSNLIYGHYIHSNSMLFPITTCNFKLPLVAEDKQVPRFERFTFGAGDKTFQCTVNMQDHLCDFVSENTEQHFKQCTIKLNRNYGSGITVFKYGINEAITQPVSTFMNIFRELPKLDSLVVDFDGPNCQQTTLTGGKGSSLAKLTAISRQTNSFIVPKGVVVTTSAYKEFIKKGKLCEAITNLEEVAWCHVTGNLKYICEQVMLNVSTTKIPEDVSEMIKE